MYLDINIKKLKWKISSIKIKYKYILCRQKKKNVGKLKFCLLLIHIRFLIISNITIQMQLLYFHTIKFKCPIVFNFRNFCRYVGVKMKTNKI